MTAQSKHPALSQRLASAKPSPTSAMSEKARELGEKGRKIYNLSEGELDFDTPDHICEAGVLAIRNGQTRYTATAGTSELKAAIIEKFRSQNGLTYGAEEIIASSGAKQILYNAFQATLDEHDEVIIPAPYWVSYPDMVALAGGTPVVVDTKPEANFKLTPDILESAITPRTKWLVLNSPSNPTGALYSQDELAALGDVLKRHPNVMVMSDEIYEHIVFDGTFHSFAAAVPVLKERTLTVNGVSKCYAMTGWRLGYAGAPSWLISALQILQSQSTSNPSSISQAATVEALNGDMEFFTDWVATLRKRRDIVVSKMSKAEGLSCASVPAAAFYIYVDCTGVIGKKTPVGTLIETDLDFAGYLLEFAGVAVVPGTAFGLSPYLRIAFSLGEEELIPASDAIIAACATLTSIA